MKNSVKQIKDFHHIQITNGKTEKLEGVVTLVSKTYSDSLEL